jgi:hypothetical protein
VGQFCRVPPPSVTASGDIDVELELPRPRAPTSPNPHHLPPPLRLPLSPLPCFSRASNSPPFSLSLILSLGDHLPPPHNRPPWLRAWCWSSATSSSRTAQLYVAPRTHPPCAPSQTHRLRRTFRQRYDTTAHALSHVMPPSPPLTLPHSTPPSITHTHALVQETPRARQNRPNPMPRQHHGPRNV